MSENLLVFGNGFDLAHGFKTSYNDFKEWLRNTYATPTVNQEEYLTVPDYATNHRNLTEYDVEKVAEFFNNLISEVCADNWRDFEAELANLDWERCFADGVDPHIRDVAALLINEYFPRWANQIDISNPKKKFDKLKDIIKNNKNYMLTFNYTDTLEIHYNTQKVCHIHGRISKKTPLLVGHGEEMCVNELYNDTENIHSDIEEIYSDIDEAIEMLHSLYKKDTKTSYENNKDFFDSLKNVSKIYFYGFSFADVDMCYLREIAKIVDCKNTIIYLHSFDNTVRQQYIENLVNAGFTKENIKILHNDFETEDPDFKKTNEKLEYIEKYSSAFSLMLAVGAPVIGVLLSIMQYGFHKGYYDYFNINQTAWLDLSNDNNIFYPIYMVLVGLLLMILNIIPEFVTRYHQKKGLIISSIVGGILLTGCVAINLLIVNIMLAIIQGLLIWIVIYGFGYIDSTADYISKFKKNKNTNYGEKTKEQESVMTALAVVFIFIGLIVLFFSTSATGASFAKSKDDFKIIQDNSSLWVVLHETDDKLVLAEAIISDEGILEINKYEQRVVENDDYHTYIWMGKFEIKNKEKYKNEILTEIK